MKLLQAIKDVLNKQDIELAEALRLYNNNNNKKVEYKNFHSKASKETLTFIEMVGFLDVIDYKIIIVNDNGEELKMIEEFKNNKMLFKEAEEFVKSFGYTIKLVEK